MQQVDELDARLQQTVRTQLDSLLLRISVLAARVQALEPREMLAQLLSRLNLAQERLFNVMSNVLSNKVHQLNLFERKLDPTQPLTLLLRSSEQLESITQRLQRAATVAMQRQAAQLDSLGQRLEGLNPRSVLKRGFALVQRKGSIVISASSIEPQDNLQIDFSDGSVDVQVVSK
jgi:exodeoxyribonuclease VII large subunit